MLNFTATEKRALLITLGIVIIAALVQYILPHTNNHQVFDYSSSDSIFYRLSKEKVNYTSVISSHPKSETKKVTSKPEPGSSFLPGEISL